MKFVFFKLKVSMFSSNITIIKILFQSFFSFPSGSKYNLSLMTETELSFQIITQTFLTFFSNKQIQDMYNFVQFLDSK
jgi:hypothetical protein